MTKNLDHDPSTNELDRNGHSNSDDLVGPDSHIPFWHSCGYTTLAHFFLKPKLVINPFPLTPEQGLDEIRVLIEKKVFRSEKARGFFLELNNNGRKTAHQVKPVIWVSLKPGLLSLTMIRPAIMGRITVEYPRTIEDFDKDKNSFALALVHDEGHEASVTLNPKGLGRVFLLFFTLKGRDAVFFPSAVHYSIKMPCSFGVAIGFDMRDQSFRLSKVFKVTAKSWDSFDAAKAEKSDFEFLRKAP